MALSHPNASVTRDRGVKMKAIPAVHAMRAELAYRHSVSAALNVLFVIAAVIFGLLSATAAAQSPPPQSSIIVKMVAGLTTADQAAVVARNGGVEVSSVPALRLHTIQVATDQLDAVVTKYRTDPQVVRVEVN